MLRLDRLEKFLETELEEITAGNFSGLSGNILVSISEESCFISNVITGRSETIYNTNDLESIIRSVGDLR